MIKINLIPTKRKPPKKITELQQQMVLGGLILVLAGIVMWYIWDGLKDRINELTVQKAKAQARIAQQETILKEVKNVEDERKKVMDKIAIIEQLKKNQTGPVRLLDDLSNAVPAGVNLTSLSQKGSQIDIDGDAFTNNDIVRFVDNLKASPLFTDVFLLETRQVTIEQVEMYKYKLQFKFASIS